MVFTWTHEGETIDMKDPVCGMELSEEKDSIIHNGKKYHFCCASCRWAFEKNPEQYIENES